MISPNKIYKFIDECELGYSLGAAVKNIVDSDDSEADVRHRISCLKNARAMINLNIKTLERGFKEKAEIKFGPGVLLSK